MNSRRSFFKKTLGAAGAMSLYTLTTKASAIDLSDSLAAFRNAEPLQASQDDELWTRIAQAYTVNPNMLNLNNVAVSPQPKIVQDAVDRFYHYSNEGPSYYMWNILDKGREPLRQKLAEFAGVSPDEVAINRNATEALATITWGLPLGRGSEIVMTRFDYPNMMNAWKQKELRDGIKINWVNLQLPFEDEDAIVKSFINATTIRTRVWHITHMLNWTGQIMPVKKLCDEARKRGILSIVDGAQSFAHLDYKISDFNPDFFGTSLHKWLSAPFGTGLLYVKKENIKSLWPLFPNDNPQSDDIRKFETLGTRSTPAEQAITQALDFHHAIGSKRKEERLRYLKNYWCEKLLTHPRIKLNISLKPGFSCGVGNFSIEGVEPEKIVNKLILDHQILTVFTKYESLSGVRIAPHVFTSTKDLDRFVNAILKIANS